MKITIKSIEMKNFKCFKEKSVKFKDTTYISGKNATGKTTIVDGILWVLFDKMSDGSTPTNIRPKNAKGEVTHFVDVSVTLDIEVDGKPMKLAKTNSEKWVKPRGQAEQEYAGTKNTYEVNGVPMGEKDYKAKIAEIISEETFKYASMGSFFLSLDSKKQRAKLFELVSDIKPEEVIKKDKDMACIKEVLENYSYDEAMALAKKEIRNCNDEIDDIPIRIDELESSKVDGDLDELNAKAEEIQDKLNSLANVDELRTEHIAITRQREEVINKAKLVFENDKFKKQNDLHLAETIKLGIEREIASLHRQKENAESQIKDLTKQLDDSRTAYRELSAKEITVTDTCPTCKRKLAEKSINSAKRAAEEQKRTGLLKIEAEGKHIAGILRNQQNIKEDIERKIESMEKNKLDKEGEINSLTREVENIKFIEPDTSYYDAKLDKIMAEVQKTNAMDRKPLEAELSEVQKEIGKMGVNDEIDNRIAELQGRQKELAQILANAEQRKYALELYNRKRVEMLTSKVNSHFRKINFVLFREQINGGLQEICEATVNGIGYGNGLNTGMCLLAEIDVATAFQRIYEVNVPIFVDNAEALSENTEKEINTECQMVYLKVSNEKLEVK